MRIGSLTEEKRGRREKSIIKRGCINIIEAKKFVERRQLCSKGYLQWSQCRFGCLQKSLNLQEYQHSPYQEYQTYFLNHLQTMRLRNSKINSPPKQQPTKKSIFQSTSTRVSKEEVAAFIVACGVKEEKNGIVNSQQKEKKGDKGRVQIEGIEMGPKNKFTSKSETFNIKAVQEFQYTDPDERQVVYRKAAKHIWLGDMNFPYFFKTLKEHPEDKIKAILPFKYTQGQQYEEDQQDDVYPQLTRKKNRDQSWRTYFRKKPEYNTRKSSRIEQIQEKQRLQMQMKDMRFSFYRGKYRYDSSEVRHRLSFLQANCQEPQEYQCQAVLDVPQKPLFQTKYSQQERQIILNAKRKRLAARIVQTETIQN